MAVNILNLDSTTQIVANTAGDTYVVEEDVYLAVLGTAISGTAAVTNRKFQIDGHVIGESAGSGMFIGQDATSGGSSTIQIAASGSVSGEAYGIVSHGGALSLVNNGSLTGATAGLYMTGEDNSVLNHGTIFAYDGVGINSQGLGAKIVNHGSISGETDGIQLAGDLSKLFNSGNIASTDPLGGYAGVRMNGNASLFVNTGSVTSYSGYAVEGYDASQTVVNHGVLDGGVDLQNGSDTFSNENGTVIGDVSLGIGADTFMTSNGSVTGWIYGGGGNDAYYIDDANTKIFEYDASGEDSVHSSVSYTLRKDFEILYLDGQADIDGFGNTGDNRLTGNAGNNWLFGRGGDDSFRFSEGNDLLNGGTGTDTVNYGDSTAAVTVNLATGKGAGAAAGQTFVSIENVLGSQFGDRLIGSASANVLEGYLGTDILTGGKGKDTFYYHGAYGKDTITDFQDNVDKIEIVMDSVTIDSFDDLDGMISQKGKNVVIDFSDIFTGDMIVIKNADLSDFSGKDFIFG